MYIKLIKIKVRKQANFGFKCTLQCLYPVFIVLGIYNFALLQNGIRQREGSCSSVWFLSWFSQENKRKS